MSLTSPTTEISSPVIPSPKPIASSWKRRVIRHLLLWVVLLTVYVLSIGPMWWAWYSGTFVSTEANYWIIAVYEPLRLACNVDWINAIVTAYIEWWNL